MLAVIVLSATIVHTSDAGNARALEKGPRTGDLHISFYPNITAAYTALKEGEIDMLGYELPRELYDDAVADPDIVLAPVSDFGMYQFDLNNNDTIYSVRDYRSPMSYVEMRRAIAFLTDKNYIVREICEGFAERIDQQLAAPAKGWANKSYWYPHYPYEYDPAHAAATLDTTFPQGTTPNPDYDPAFPGSARYLRTYPGGHEKAGQNLDALKFVIRNDDIWRLNAGQLIASNAKKLGIPVDLIEGSHASIYERVYGQFDYHLYTGGKSQGNMPAVTLYDYHSSDIYPYGSNYVTGIRENEPRYPHLDEYLERARFPANYSEAVQAVKLAVGYMTEECMTIPLYSPRSYWAYSRVLLGVVNMESEGPLNRYTLMNAYKIDGTAIRIGLKSAPVQMNSHYSSWYYDYQCLDRMNLGTDWSSILKDAGVNVPPYDLSIQQPSFVWDWETGTWVDPADNKTKTKVTKWFTDKGFFTEPVTGNQKANVNSSHYFFNVWYDYNLNPTVWLWGDIADIHHIVMNDSHTVTIYFDSLSYWNTYYANEVFRPMDTWAQQPELVTQSSASFAVTGPVTTNIQPCWVSSINVDGMPLTQGTEWNIVKGKLTILNAVSGTLNVDYWEPNDAQGYTPGNVAWQTIFEGAGMYYAVDFAPGASGFLALKKNPHYWMETPLLGEVDFAWQWATGPKPRDGSYSIDILDVVKAAGAYGSHGTGVPDARWIAGADVAPPGGQIDIFDIVTITGKYGEAW
jgi:hypothetical protein